MIFGSSFAQKVPSVVTAVDLTRYMGTWYEIARLPNSFERKLKCITANYTLRKDRKINVLNKGIRIKSPDRTSSARGVAWIPDMTSPAKLKVMFFWPFSGDYWIMYLDKDYRFVLVGEPTFKYLWILSREKRMEEGTIRMLVQIATDSGYDVSSLIRVEHNCD